MMKEISILIFGLMLSYNGLSQSCLSEGAWFYYQSQIDNFQTDYPGCTIIEGDVKIYGPLVRNLTGLSVLTAIDGDLEIVDTDSLYSLSGLDNLTNIEGSLTIENNPFLTDLSGLNSLSTISDNLAIDNNDLLLNLNGLGNLVSVEGNFYIRGNPALESLEGIHRLQNIENNFYIGYYEPEDGNPSLTDLTGLDSLSSIGGRFYIQNNASLMSVNGLTRLNYLYGDLAICDNTVFNDLSAFLSLTEMQSGGIAICANPLLTSLYGLNNITTCAGIKIADNPLLPNLDGLENLAGAVQGITIENNELLCNLDPLHNITSTENFWIRNNPSLTNLSGLHGLDSIYHGLHLQSNNSLKNLEGLDSLQYIASSLWIINNDSLENIFALDHVSPDSITFLYISGNQKLIACNSDCICNFLSNPSGVIYIYDNAPGCNNPPEIAADCGITLPCLPYGNYYLYTQADIDNFQVNYPDCFQVKGNVNVQGNGITNLEGLSMVSSISESLNISYTNMLTDLSGLENLDTVGNLYIMRDTALISLSGLDNLSYVKGLLDVYSNAVLPDLSGLESLKIIGGELILSHNESMTSLAGLNNLKKVGDGMTISHNDSLIDLSALNSLKYISGDLFIWYNEKLQTLDGIGNIQASSINDLYISNNPRLSSCAENSICNFILEPYGNFSIHDNAIGCDSPEEVETACVVGLNDGNLSESQFSIFPIPSSTRINIKAPISLSNFQISIFNLNGQEVLQRQLMESETVIDVVNLPSGIYIVKLISDVTVKVFKIVKE